MKPPTLDACRPLGSLLAALVAIGLATGCAAPAVVAVGAAGAGVAVAQQRPAEEAIQDLATEAVIQDAMFQEEFQDLYRKVNVIVVEGRVLLTGTAPAQEQRDKAEEIARGSEGVREVINEIMVGEDVGIVQAAADTRISLEIRTRQVAAENVRQRNYWTTTENGVVYMIGIARTEEELAEAIDIARNVDGVVKVVNHVILRDDPRRLQPRSSEPG